MSAWRDRLDNLSAEKVQEGRDKELTKPTKPSSVSFVSEQKDHAADFSSVMRRLLLRIAAAEGIAPEVIHALDEGDIAACRGESENTLRTYVRALHRDTQLGAGKVPCTWTAVVECRGCGPVLLWPECPPEVIACPWCRHRKAGVSIPRPPTSP